MRRVESDGVSLQDQPPHGVNRDGTASVDKTEVSDLHEAVRQDMLEEPADKLDGVEVGGALS